MAVSLRAAVAASARTSTSITLPKPTGTVDGDRLIAYIWGDSATQPTLTGWTLYDSMTGSYGGVSRWGWWLTKVAASEGSTFVFTTGSSASPFHCGVVVAIQNGAAPEAITKADHQNGGSPFLDIIWGSVTSLGAGRLILLTIGYNNNVATVNWPSGCTQGAADQLGGSGGGDAFVGSKTALVGAGATGTFTGTSGAAEGGKYQLGTIAIPEAAAAASTFVPRVAIL